MIRVGTLIGTSTIEDGGKAQPGSEKTRVSGYSLTTSPPTNKKYTCLHSPDLVDEDASKEDDNNIPELSTLIGNEENSKATGNPVLHESIQTSHSTNRQEQNAQPTTLLTL